jgi:large subunit ribosomal protein L5
MGRHDAVLALGHSLRRSLSRKPFWMVRSLSSAVSPAKSSAISPTDDLENSPFVQDTAPNEDIINSYNPIRQTKNRKSQLPPSRYKFRPPKYYRGPLHPHQPPPASDIASREFIPGPFTHPRLEQTYHSTIASDMLALMYSHIPPGEQPPPPAPRLPKWVGDSPYFANRPARAPRGGRGLRPLHKPITFRNIPEINGITVHTHIGQAAQSPVHLSIAGIALRVITGMRPSFHTSRVTISEWDAKAGTPTSATVNMKGEEMYNFLSKLVDLVLPRIKDWKGANPSSGDGTGNISFGLTPEAVALFPEIEINYDM